jgi:hypothetical protein
MYPHAFRTVSAATTDTAGGNIQNQLFIPFSEQVMILVKPTFMSSFLAQQTSRS